MANPFFYIWLIILFCWTAQAQNKVDSLKNVLAVTNQDTTRINTYLHFFYTDLFYDDPEEVINYMYKARDLSEGIDYSIGEIKAHNNLGYTYRTRSENDSAFHHYGQVIQKAQEGSFYKELTDAYIGVGNTYNQIGEWDKAVEQFQTVINLAIEEGDTVQVGSAHNNIGNTYLNQSKFEKALKNYQKSAELGDESIRGVALINMAVVHNQMGNLQKARTYFEKSIADAQRLEKRGHLAFIYRNLGILEKKSGNYAEAITYYENALKHYKGLSDDFSTSEIMQNMGNVFFEQKDFTRAFELYEESLRIQQKIEYYTGACYNLLYMANTHQKMGELNRAKQALEKVQVCGDTLDLLPAKSDALGLMSKILEQQGNYKEALEYQIAFKDLSDSIAGMNSEEKIAELDTKYQTSQKEQEIKLLSAENAVANLKIDKQNNLRNFLILAAIILSILAFLLYNRFTLKKRANQKLRELDTLKNKFYTNISHEFRTPLTLILNPLEQMLKQENSKKEKNNIALAHKNAQHLLQLTNQILDLSKLEAGKLQLEVAPENIKDFLSVVASSFESLAASKNISFKSSFTLENDVGYIDTYKLKKILNNLLSNAFKFVPAGGRIDFVASTTNEVLDLSVKDTGPGLREDEKEFIFERFQQGERQSTSGGTGIGLTLTKELVLLHHGTITLESAKGKGSTFQIEIPIHKDFYKKSELVLGKFANQRQSSNFINREEKIVERHSAKGLPIALIVEDNMDLRNYLGSLLEDNYQVRFGVDGKDGLNKALELIPDIIISDWMMPGMNGDQLCEAVKKDERTSHIPVILLTAKADEKSKLKGLTLGADDYLSKPFNNEELLVRSENLINQRKALRNKYADTLLVEPSKISISDPDKSFIERVMNIANSNITNADYTVEQFQKDVGMSRTQLHRKLKALINQSASEFIRGLRLQRAADMLSQGHLQISEVAYQCGFNNLSYFGKCFKEKFSVTPSQYTT